MFLRQFAAVQSPTCAPSGSEHHPQLGQPLTIEEVARLLGCSPWTVRQRYLSQGLPHLRASAGGKFVFFSKQVLQWIQKRQRKEECK